MSGGSGAATMRNAVKRITHKERAQPLARQKLGLLEKHKDYKKRAYDFQKKQKYIKSLRKKAAERNPDEFYRQMHNSKVSNGVHRSTVGNAQLDPEVLKLMKTQDLGYITHRKSIDDGKIRQLQQNLHLIGKKKPKTHKYFCEDDEEFDETLYVKKMDSEGVDEGEDYKQEGEDDVNRKKDMHTNVGKFTKKDILKLKLKKDKSYNELERRIARSKKLETASNALILQRNLTNSKGTKRKIKVDPDDPSKVVYKWKRQRAK